MTFYRLLSDFVRILNAKFSFLYIIFYLEDRHWAGHA